MCKFNLIILFSLVAAIQCQTFWRPCPTGPSPTFVAASHCTDTICTVEIGDHLEGNFTFTPTTVENFLPVRLFLLAAGFPELELEVESPHDNACDAHIYRDGVEVGCPTVPGAESVWVFHSDVPADLPAFSNADFRFEINDGRTLCVLIHAELVH